MNLFTYGDIKTKLQNDLDCEDLDFVNGDEELVGYVNEAIRDAEAIIHTLGLDSRYFLRQGTLTLVPSTSDYELPSDIFATKICKLFYINGTTKYEIFRVRDFKRLPFFQPSDDYEYILLNVPIAPGEPNGMRIRLFPTPEEAGDLIQTWYIRKMLTLSTDAADTDNVCEVPECVNFIFQHVKRRVYEKMGNPNLSLAESDLQRQTELMKATLQEMVPDENTEAQQDFSFYTDSWLDVLRY